jgi:serine/threonine-protein kinase
VPDDDRGEFLDVRLRREGALPAADVAALVTEVLTSLAELHARGRVHRAVSPSAIRLERHGRTERVLLVDPPLRPKPSLTSRAPDFTEQTLFPFAFMSPEQVRGSAGVDARSDVYAVGALAFVALTARSPFASANILTLIALKLDRPPPTLSSATGRPWPAALERFVATAMAADPRDRYPTADAALRACRELGVTAIGRA